MNPEWPDDIAEVCFQPGRWKWVSRFERAPARVIRHPQHRQWMKGHSKGHPFREMMWTLAGRHFYGARGAVYRAEPGTVFLFDKGEPHDDWYSPYQPDGRDLWLHLVSPHLLTVNEVITCGGFMQSGFSTAAGDEGTQRIQRYRPLEGPLVECLTRCWDVCSGGEVRPAAQARLKAAAIMVLLAVLSACREARDERPRDAHQRAIVGQIQDYIAAHLGDDLSLASLARVAGYEAAYFHRLFHRCTGERLRVFINRLRLERAKALLKKGQTVQSVAEELGFGTAAYFSRFFHTAAGRPPATWRERGEAKG